MILRVIICNNVIKMVNILYFLNIITVLVQYQIQVLIMCIMYIIFILPKMNPNSYGIKLMKLSLILLLIHNGVCFNKFCSVYCQNQQCNSPNSNDCFANKCAGGFSWSTTTLKCQPANGYQIADTSHDIGGSIYNNNNYLQICHTNIGGWSYQYFQDRYSIQFYNYAGITMPHYQIRIIFWIVFVDELMEANSIQVTVITGDEQLRKSMSETGRQTSQKACGDPSRNDYLFRFDETFNHNITDYYNTISVTGPIAKKRAIKEFIILAKLCNNACLSCFGSHITQCYSCKSHMYLSNTTCNQTCLTGYGKKTGTKICIVCDQKCTACQQTPTNCLSCRQSGEYQSYLLAIGFSASYESCCKQSITKICKFSYKYIILLFIINYHSFMVLIQHKTILDNNCLLVCPVGYYQNTANHVCQPCLQQFCLECQDNQTECTKCDSSSGYVLYQYSCVEQCPIGTLLEQERNICAVQAQLSPLIQKPIHQPSIWQENKIAIIASFVTGAVAIISVLAIFICWRMRSTKNSVSALTENKFTLQDQTINESSFNKRFQTEKSTPQNNMKTNNISIEDLQNSEQPNIRNIEQNVRQENIFAYQAYKNKVLTTSNAKNSRRISETNILSSKKFVNAANR